MDFLNRIRQAVSGYFNNPAARAIQRNVVQPVQRKLNVQDLLRAIYQNSAQGRAINNVQNQAQQIRQNPQFQQSEQNIAQKLQQVPNIKLRGIQQLFGQNQAPTLGDLGRNLPVVGEAIKFGTTPQPNLKQFTQGITSTGYKYSPVPGTIRLGSRGVAELAPDDQLDVPTIGKVNAFSKDLREQGVLPTAINVGVDALDALTLGKIAKSSPGLKQLAGDEAGYVGSNARVSQLVDQGQSILTRLHQAQSAGKKTQVKQLTKALKSVELEKRRVITKLSQGGYIGNNADDVNAVGKTVGGEIPPPKLKSSVAPEAPIPQLKTRGFKKNVFKSNFYQKDDPTIRAVVESIPGYKPYSNTKLLTKAVKTVDADPELALAKIMTKPQLTSSADVATGHVLMRKFIEDSNVDAAVEVGKKLGIDGTELGRAVQAYATWKKTTPEGILKLAVKNSQAAGRELDGKTAKELVDAAKKIQNMPTSIEKYKATRDLLYRADQTGQTWKDYASQALSTPRAAMATADLSAPLRQGAVLGSRFPKIFAKNSKDSVKYFGSQKAFDEAMFEITQRPSFALMQRHGLAVDGANGLAGTEELFLKNILETDALKKVGIGRVVAGSDRAYTGFLTKMRADAFDRILADSEKAGVKLDEKAMQSLVKFINSASGRGDGNITRQVSRLQVLFSPRLWKSRLDVLNPVYYARLDPVARKYALQSSAAFMGIVATTLGLAKASGLDVGTDPRSADFAKIKIGNTRYDIMGGLQQNIRLIAQMATGEKVNSETGEIQTLGPERGFGKPSRKDLLYQFIENKENPIVAYGSKLLQGSDAAGNKINPLTEGGKLLIPLGIQGAYETSKDQGSIIKGLALNAPSTFGIGVQTYGKKKEGEKKSTTTASGKIKAYEPDSGKKLVTTEKLQEDADKLRQELKGVKDSSVQTLVKYDRLSPDGKEKFKSSPKNVYDLAVANYDKDMRKGLNVATMIKREKEIAQLGVKKDFSKDAVDLYSLSKTDLRDVIEGGKVSENTLNELAKLDNAMLKAGFVKNSKFAFGKSGGGRGSRGRSGSGKIKTAQVPTFKKINVSLKTARVSQPRKMKFKTVKLGKKLSGRKVPIRV